jgi:hypothetical protein
LVLQGLSGALVKLACDSAESAVEEVRRANPNYTLDYAREFIPFAREIDLKHFINNLALAGL